MSTALDEPTAADLVARVLAGGGVCQTAAAAGIPRYVLRRLLAERTTAGQRAQAKSAAVSRGMRGNRNRAGYDPWNKGVFGYRLAASPPPPSTCTKVNMHPPSIADPDAALAEYRAGRRVEDIADARGIRQWAVYSLIEREIPPDELRELKSRNMRQRTGDTLAQREARGSIASRGRYAGVCYVPPADKHPERPTFRPGGTVAWVRVARLGPGRPVQHVGLPADWRNTEARWQDTWGTANSSVPNER